MLSVVYRISDSGNQKEKLAIATKLFCLKNCLTVFGKEAVLLFADRCLPQTLEEIKSLGISPIETDLGNSLGWRFAAKYAMDTLKDEDMIYFVEDDYLHLPPSPNLLGEGIELADYVSLYDHPDKYSDGLDSSLKGEGEIAQVMLTKSCHWKTSNSTTMTFATKRSTLKEDWPIWMEFTELGFPNDFGAFQHLQGLGSWENKISGNRRRLITSIPGHCTHAETSFLTPLVDWTKMHL